MTRWRQLLFIAFFTITCRGDIAAQTSATGHYLFSYFVGNGEDGLHLLHSTDGLAWKKIANGRSLLKPEVGRDKLMRDPAVVQGPEGTFHMVWTVSWGERGVGYSSSRDLIHWTPQRYLPVMEHEPTARNCWAPEAFYDAPNKQFLVCWATTIPGKFSETDGQTRRNEDDPGYDHRMYYVTTPDFETLSPAKLFYDQGFNVIDATLIQDGQRFVMILKDETDRPHKPEKNLRVAFAEKAVGPYGLPSAPITGNYWAEGPTAIKIGDKWHVYFDKYRDHKYGMVTSPDLVEWTDESDMLRIPSGVRHGTVFEASPEIAEGVLELE
jgi:sucrose-6-phosphate hydrolase SacC (GH32 family)